jgi:hypothetical protein
MNNQFDELAKVLASDMSRRTMLRSIAKLGIAALGARLLGRAGIGMHDALAQPQEPETIRSQ